MYIIIMKQIASPGSMHETGCSGLVHWDDPEGWHGVGAAGSPGVPRVGPHGDGDTAACPVVSMG